MGETYFGGGARACSTAEVRIGVIGGGRVGSALAASWRDRGHEVAVSTRTTLGETAADAEVVVLALPATAVSEALAETGSLEGKVLLDATNNVSGGPSGLEIAALAPAARYVKAFNTIFSTFMHDTPPNPGAACVYCGDDASANGIVAQLIADVGLDPVDVGGSEATPWIEGFFRVVLALGYAQGRGPFVYRFEPS
jgi:8-hydroxy-5-deazaflavin:NADPH oxidoreductase